MMSLNKIYFFGEGTEYEAGRALGIRNARDDYRRERSESGE